MHFPSISKEAFQAFIHQCGQATTTFASNIHSLFGRHFYIFASPQSHHEFFQKTLIDHPPSNRHLADYKISKIHNRENDCFVITVLRTLAHLPVFENQILYSSENLSDNQEVKDVKIAMQDIVLKIHRGEAIKKREIANLRYLFGRVGLDYRPTKFRKILESIFPFIFSSPPGDVFALYNHLRRLYGENDFWIPTPSYPNPQNFFSLFEHPIPIEKPIVAHLYADPKNPEKISLLIQDQRAKEVLVHHPQALIRVNFVRKEEEKISDTPVGIEESFTIEDRLDKKRFELKIVQCSPNFEHSLVYLNKEGQWFYCDGNEIIPVSFEEIKKEASSHCMHLFYEASSDF